MSGLHNFQRKTNDFTLGMLRYFHPKWSDYMIDNKIKCWENKFIGQRTHYKRIALHIKG